MNHLTIYLDSQHAKVFDMSSLDHAPLLLEDPHERTAREEDHGRDVHKNERRLFFHEVAKKIKESKQVYLLGPRPIINEFKKYVKKNDPSLVDKLAGDEVIRSHVSDNQVWAKGHNFFLEF